MTRILAGSACGFSGSLHCIGMCGPLAHSLPGPDTSRLRFLLERLRYNLGRAMAYTALGGAVGGQNRFDAAYTPHLNAQNPFSGEQIPEPGRVLTTGLAVQFSGVPSKMSPRSRITDRFFL